MKILKIHSHPHMRFSSVHRRCVKHADCAFLSQTLVLSCNSNEKHALQMKSAAIALLVALNLANAANQLYLPMVQVANQWCECNSSVTHDQLVVQGLRAQSRTDACRRSKSAMLGPAKLLLQR